MCDRNLLYFFSCLIPLFCKLFKYGLCWRMHVVVLTKHDTLATNMDILRCFRKSIHWPSPTWSFYYRTVKTNFRVCVISPGDMTGFQRRCREYPSFTKNINFLWFLHWSKRQLIEYAMFHLKGVLFVVLHRCIFESNRQFVRFGAIQEIRNTFYLEILHPPTSRNASIVELYIFVTLFSRKSDTLLPPTALHNTWMAPLL